MSAAQRAKLSDMDDLIGTAEATRILSVDKTTITRWVASGKLVPAMKLPKVNGAYLFHRSQVEALKDK
jgi:predicted site-specific integrase-resolvase